MHEVTPYLLFAVMRVLGVGIMFAVGFWSAMSGNLWPIFGGLVLLTVGVVAMTKEEWT